MKKWRLLKSDIILATRWFTMHKNKYLISDDTFVDDYYIINRSDFVLIVALQNEDLVLVNQYRPATDNFYLALPAGYIELGESPVEAAKRELLEETGFISDKGILIGELHPLPGYVNSKAFVVVCEVVSKSNITIDTLEIDSVEIKNWSTVLNLISKGEINEMQAVSAILLTKQFLTDDGVNL